jgi:hypothetical protein
MGVTIHYSGKLKTPETVIPLMDEVEEICFTNNWSCQRINPEGIVERDDFPDADNPIQYAFEKGMSQLWGITFKPHQECESVGLLFDIEGVMHSPMSIILKDKKPFNFTKTQFAGPETHIVLIKLLLYLKKKYFKSMKISDDGGYYPKNDLETLKTRMGLINAAINTVDDILNNSDFSGKTPDEFAEFMRDALQRSFGGMRVEVMKFEMPSDSDDEDRDKPVRRRRNKK